MCPATTRPTNVAEISASIEFNDSPESVWRVLLALDAWPVWSPIFQEALFHDPAVGVAGGFTAQGLIGRVPYRAEFMVPEYQPLRRFIFESVTVTSPLGVIWHDVQLENRRLTWSITYTVTGGPGGFLVDRLMVRRSTLQQLENHLAAINREIARRNHVG